MASRATAPAENDPLHVLRERAGIILACALVGALAALVIGLFAQDRRSESKAEVTAAQPLTTLRLNVGYAFSVADRVTAAVEDGELANRFQARVSKRVDGVSPGEVSRDITFLPPTEAATVTILASGDDDQEALGLGRAAVKEIALEINRSASAQTEPMLRAARSAGNPRLTAVLEVDRAALSNLALVTQRPVLTQAKGRRDVAVNLVAGLVLGALIGAAIAFLSHRSRQASN